MVSEAFFEEIDITQHSLATWGWKWPQKEQEPWKYWLLSSLIPSPTYLGGSGPSSAHWSMQHVTSCAGDAQLAWRSSQHSNGSRANMKQVKKREETNLMKFTYDQRQMNLCLAFLITTTTQSPETQTLMGKIRLNPCLNSFIESQIHQLQEEGVI